MTNLLAIIMPGDEFHDSVLEFIESLPNESIMFDSLGYTGNLERNLNEGFKTNNRRHFLVLGSPTFEDLATEYFKSTPNSALIEIPDGLKVKIHYKIQDDYGWEPLVSIKGPYTQWSFGSSVNEMIQMYDGLSSTNPITLLDNAIDKDNVLRKHAFTDLLGFKKQKSHPLFVSVGIETFDEQYLLGTTYAQGPFVMNVVNDKS